VGLLVAGGMKYHRARSRTGKLSQVISESRSATQMSTPGLPPEGLLPEAEFVRLTGGITNVNWGRPAD
jgi:hypothetical protein